jgi:trehalose synthase
VLHRVDIGAQPLAAYQGSAGSEAIDLLHELAAPLQGRRVLHVNATPYGGGVAEILRSEIPLLRDLGLVADWSVISGSPEFFAATKAIHDALQGAPKGLTAEQWDVFLANSTHNARLLDEDYDVVVIHDPQPLALPALRGRGPSSWVWRCHIDTSEPNLEVWERLRSYLREFDAAQFTMSEFAPPDLPVARVEIVPPAIDPQSPKNLELGDELGRQVLRWIGVDLDRPLLAQVSRFDPWKDPLGVIAAYRLVREEVPGVQLALAASMALDDPEAWDVYRQIEEAAHDDADIHLFTNLTGVGNVEVNAIQRLSDVVLQKSIREGFGLVVSETLWKGTPVVAGRAGGIPLQVEDGRVGGYLVDSVEETAERVLRLLRDPALAGELGMRGRELVRRKFLLPRLIADDLRLYASLLGSRTPQVAPT